MTSRTSIWALFLGVGLALAAVDLWTKKVVLDALEMEVAYQHLLGPLHRPAPELVPLVRAAYRAERGGTGRVVFLPRHGGNRELVARVPPEDLDLLAGIVARLDGAGGDRGDPGAGRIEARRQPYLRNSRGRIDGWADPYPPVEHQERIVIIPRFFELEAALNYGAFSGWFGSFTGVLAIVSLVALALVALFLHLAMRGGARVSPWFVAALALLWGGTLGNYYDRQFIGGVRDFIKWFVVIDGTEHVWPNFNLADSGICVGVTLIVLLEIVRSLRRGEPARAGREECSPPATTAETGAG